jgi:hypothetical protein
MIPLEDSNNPIVCVLPDPVYPYTIITPLALPFIQSVTINLLYAL